MQFNLKVIKKNGENILPVCFYGKNRNSEVIEYHKKVMDFWGISMNYLEMPFDRAGHGDFIQFVINQTIDSDDVDYWWFCDMDCIPLRGDFIDILYDKIKDKNSIFGPALATNHREKIKNHIYAAAFCLSFSKKVYNDVGRPLMTDMIKRSDNSQELTWKCQEQGKTISYMWPTTYQELTEEEMLQTGNPKYFNLGEYHKYGMSTQYGDMIFHGFVQNIKRSNENFINKCKDILYGKKDKMDCVVISVNCADYLELTLPENIKYFNNYYVGTVATDIETIEICKKYGAMPVICSDPHDINGFQFDKGSCIQECLKQIKDRDRWILSLDADIVLTENFKLDLEKLNKNTLYGASRSFAWDYNEYLEYKNGKKIEDFDGIEGGDGNGYFQLFYANSDKIKHLSLEYVYPNGNISTDISFLRLFHPDIVSVGRSGLKVLHLGGYSLFENGRIDNRGRFEEVKGKKFKKIPNLKKELEYI